jgi:hypothetical protein
MFNTDIVLGGTFLRSVYALFDFGDLIQETNAQDASSDPYVQLITTVDESLAHQDFISLRSNSGSTKGKTGSKIGLSSGDAEKSSDSSLNGSSGSDNKGLSYAALGLAAGAFLISIGTFIYSFLNARQNKRGIYQPVSNPKSTQPVFDSNYHSSGYSDAEKGGF